MTYLNVYGERYRLLRRDREMLLCERSSDGLRAWFAQWEIEQ